MNPIGVLIPRQNHNPNIPKHSYQTIIDNFIYMESNEYTFGSSVGLEIAPNINLRYCRFLNLHGQMMYVVPDLEDMKMKQIFIMASIIAGGKHPICIIYNPLDTTEMFVHCANAISPLHVLFSAFDCILDIDQEELSIYISEYSDGMDVFIHSLINRTNRKARRGNIRP